MGTARLDPKNWYEVYWLYHEHIFAIYPQTQAVAIWNTFKTAFLRFLLQEMGFCRENPQSKMMKVEVEAAENYLKTMSMLLLPRIRNAMAAALKKLGASNSSCNTYTSRINQFLDWGEQQDWWPNNRGKNGRFRVQCRPRLGAGGKIRRPKLIPGKSVDTHYGLQENQLPKELQLKLKAMRQFLVEPNNPERTFTAIEESTAKNYQKAVLLLLGWFYQFRSVPLEELSLDLIFPVFDADFLDSMTNKEKEKFWRKQKFNLKRWLCDYRTFLQQAQHSYSPRTWFNRLEAVLAVGRFQWANEVEHKEDYSNIPLIRQLREELNNADSESKHWQENGRYVVDQTLKWPDMPDGKTALEVLQETVVEALRLQCRPRTAALGKVCHARSIASCYQIFLIWAWHVLIPAHRQQVARTEQVATSCPIERPASVPIDGLYQPLPPDVVLPKRHNGTVKVNFLCRLYTYKGVNYPEGVWIRIIRDYKTWKKHGDQEYIIPNWTFNDGSQLYNYIEQYLYGYWLPGSFKGSQTYTWSQPELQGQRGKWVSAGRAEFNPSNCCKIEPSGQTPWTWSNLFLKPEKNIPFKDSDFSQYFARGALITIGKWTTPHILRSVWATWAYSQGLSEAELRSLAYSMGMTIETLYKTYERCTTKEKRQAIEQSIKERLLRVQEEEVVSVEKLILLARNLNLVDRQKLVIALLDKTSR